MDASDPTVQKLMKAVGVDIPLPDGWKFLAAEDPVPNVRLFNMGDPAWGQPRAPFSVPTCLLTIEDVAHQHLDAAEYVKVASRLCVQQLEQMGGPNSGLSTIVNLSDALPIPVGIFTHVTHVTQKGQLGPFKIDAKVVNLMCVEGGYAYTLQLLMGREHYEKYRAKAFDIANGITVNKVTTSELDSFKKERIFVEDAQKIGRVCVPSNWTMKEVPSSDDELGTEFLFENAASEHKELIRLIPATCAEKVRAAVVPNRDIEPRTPDDMTDLFEGTFGPGKHKCHFLVHKATGHMLTCTAVLLSEKVTTMDGLLAAVLGLYTPNPNRPADRKLSSHSLKYLNAFIGMTHAVRPGGCYVSTRLSTDSFVYVPNGVGNRDTETEAITIRNGDASDPGNHANLDAWQTAIEASGEAHEIERCEFGGRKCVSFFVFDKESDRKAKVVVFMPRETQTVMVRYECPTMKWCGDGSTLANVVSEFLNSIDFQDFGGELLLNYIG